MALPTTANRLIRPLASPRDSVGNSSGPYTARAGTAMAPITVPSSDHTQIWGPLVTNIRR